MTIMSKYENAEEKVFHLFIPMIACLLFILLYYELPNVTFLYISLIVAFIHTLTVLHVKLTCYNVYPYIDCSSL